MTRRLEKVTDLLKGTRYDMPEPHVFDQELISLQRSIEERYQIVAQTNNQIIELLKKIRYDLNDEHVSDNYRSFFSSFFLLSSFFFFFLILCFHLFPIHD